MLLTSNEWIEPADLATLTRKPAPAQFQLSPDGVSLEEVERQLLAQALERADGNQTQAAQLLGINRDQVRYRIEKWGLIARSIASRTSRMFPGHEYCSTTAVLTEGVRGSSRAHMPPMKNPHRVRRFPRSTVSWRRSPQGLRPLCVQTPWSEPVRVLPLGHAWECCCDHDDKACSDQFSQHERLAGPRGRDSFAGVVARIVLSLNRGVPSIVGNTTPPSKAWSASPRTD